MMNKTAAILYKTTYDNYLNELKQILLLFDMVGVGSLKGLLRDLEDEQKELDTNTVDELNLLIDKKYVIDSLVAPPPTLPEELLKKIQVEINFLYNLSNRLDEELLADGQARFNAFILNVLNQEKKVDFYSVPLLKKLQLPKEMDSARVDVINLLIEKIPIPDDKTPWEAIFDFKNDSDNKGRMVALRKWVNKIVKSNVSAAEMRDEIDDLLYRYRKSLDIHKIKHRNGTLQTIVVGSAEILENVLTFKFSKIAKELFSVNQSKVDLMNLELNAPGNELAYIYQTHDKFSRD
jgi:hypothetical protein